MHYAILELVGDIPILETMGLPTVTNRYEQSWGKRITLGPQDLDAQVDVAMENHHL